MSHNFNRGDLVQIKRNEKNAGRGFNRTHNEQMAIVVDGKYSYQVQIQLFTGEKITVWPAHLKIVRRAQSG